jgi:Ulp1 family protease
MGLQKPHEKREKTAVAFRGAGYVTLRVASRMRCAWLYDETINAYMWLLQERDKALCLADPSRKPTYFFSSFFFEKMFENQEQYSYPSVERWARKVPMPFSSFQAV